MLNSLYELGKLWIEKENLKEVDVLLDIEKLKKNTKRVILVELKQLSENKFDFDKISIKEFDLDDVSKYLYKFGSSRGTDITPTCIIREPKKSFDNKFFKWFEQNHNNNEFLVNLFDCLNNNNEEIIKGISDVYSNIESKLSNNVLLSLVINDNDLKYYVGDYTIFKDILISKASKKYYKFDSKKVKGQSVCFLCDEEKEVYGLVSNSIGFAFSTPEKKGNVSEFNVINQWKQLPICGECALYLEAGKKFVEKFLSFKEFGLSYYVIPSFLFEPSKSFNRLFKIIKRFESKSHYHDIVEKEDKFKNIVDEMGNVLEFKFMFYKSYNNAFDILAYNESILPSWMKQIYENQIIIMNCNIFQEDALKTILSQNIEGDLIEVINGTEKYHPINLNNWYFGFLRNFFITSKSFKSYLDLVNSVLTEKKLNFSFLLQGFMAKIRTSWRNQNEYMVKLETLKALSLILLFDSLNLLREEKIMSSEIQITEDVIEKVLNTSDKKSTFYLGVLTRKLTYEQYKELGSSPFINKLWGLSLDKKKIQKLYPMVLNKLQEYKKAHIYKDIQEKISSNLIKAENSWALTRDETSYYFVLGYTLAYTIDMKNEKETN